MQRWKLEFNYGKSKEMHFRIKRSARSEVPFHIGNGKIGLL